MSPQSSIFRITLVGLVSLALAMGIGRFAFTPLLPMMREDELVSIMDGGFLASIHFLGYWLGAVFATKIPCPPKMMLRLSLFAIGVGTVGMGLRSLEIFRTVAVEGSVTRAAIKLNRVQSNISTRIKQLEQHLKKNLFCARTEASR